MRTSLTLAAAALATTTSAIPLDVTSTSSIKAAAATVVEGIFSYYKNNATGPNTQPWQVGLFPFFPYYWWESGAVWGGMMDYYAYTADDSYLNATLTAMAAQTGPDYDYVPPQQMADEANDDQAFWAFNLVTALEYSLPLLPCPNGTSNSGTALADLCPSHWLVMADNIFNEYVGRYLNASEYCNGGLRWQFNPNLNGYTYKNSISNGGFFQLAARLFRYTGNSTYGDWATRVYDWESGVGYISAEYAVHDGAGIDQNCTALDPTQWTYNMGVWTYGAAAMSAAGAAGPWTARVEGFVGHASTQFFSPFSNATDVMFEPTCEEALSCDTDQQSFKAYLARWLAKSGVLVPSVAANVSRLLQASAAGAAASCSGPDNACGSKWYTGGFDGQAGLGQQLTALEAIQGLLIGSAPAPATMGH